MDLRRAAILVPLASFLLLSLVPSARCDAASRGLLRRLNPPPAGLEDDVNIFDATQPSNARGKRTIDVLLQGLAEALGYELRPRGNATRQPPKPATAPAATPKVPPLAPEPPKPSPRPPKAEDTTPKGTNASDTDLLAQKDEPEEDAPGGEVDDYFRDTAGEYFRNEYDRIRASEKNPPWTGNYYEDDKEKEPAPAKRDEDRDDNYYQYYFPAYNAGGGRGGSASGSGSNDDLPKYSFGSSSAEAPKYTFSVTSEGPYYVFGKPLSYTFDIPYQTPQPQEQQQQQFSEAENSEEDDDTEVESDPTTQPLLNQNLFVPAGAEKDPNVVNTFKASYDGKLPIVSTSKPRMAQILQEMEGTKQDSLWPPPFDYAFDSTDASVVAEKPAAIVQQNSVVAGKSSQLTAIPSQWPPPGYLPGNKLVSLVTPQQAPPLANARQPEPSYSAAGQSAVVDSVVQNALKWIASQTKVPPKTKTVPAQLIYRGGAAPNISPPVINIGPTPIPRANTRERFAQSSPSNSPSGPEIKIPQSSVANSLNWYNPSSASLLAVNTASQQTPSQPTIETKTTSNHVAGYLGFVVPNPYSTSGSAGYGVAQASDLLTASPTSPGDVKAAAPEGEFRYSQLVDSPRSEGFPSARPPAESKPENPEREQYAPIAYVSSTTEPSYYQSQPLIVSSPKPFTREPYPSNNALFFQSSSQEQTGTHKPYPYYQNDDPASTIKPYIPPANHYGIRVASPTTTTTTTTSIPPRSQEASQKQHSAAPPTGHYGIRLPPPPPPPPPQRRPRLRLSPEELARRHHEEFLRHSHHPDDYDHQLYEEYPEIAGARYLYEDDEQRERGDEDAAPSEEARGDGQGGDAPRWRPGPAPYEPPAGARDFYRPPPPQQQQQHHSQSSFAVQSPLSDDYTSLDYYFADPPAPRYYRRPRPSARLALREAEEAAEAVKRRSELFTTPAPAAPTAPAAEGDAPAAPSTSKSLTKETISRVSKLQVTGKVQFYPDLEEGLEGRVGLRRR